jgi:hypothetical protein
MLDEDILNRRNRDTPSARSIGIVSVVAGIALDISAAGLLALLAGTCVSMRFVQHICDDDPDGTRFKTLVRGLQLSATEIRFVVLPAGPDPTDRALANFLVEPAACAGQCRIGAGR